MKDYTNESPAFSDKIKILETTDTDHADNFNVFITQLLDNDVALKALFDEFVGRLKEIVFTGSYNDLEDKPENFPPSSHKHAKSDITDLPSSMPASDVSSWAKAANKPSYNWSEIGSKPSIPAAVRVKGNSESTYRTGDVNLTPANIGAAPSSHSHSEYAAASHSHSNYAAASHSHSSFGALSIGNGHTLAGGAYLVVGKDNKTSRWQSCTIGRGCTNNGYEALIAGSFNTAANDSAAAFAAGEYLNVTSHRGVAFGMHNTVKNDQMVAGHHNNDSLLSTPSDGTGTLGTAFAIGNGYSNSKSNAFRVDYNGTVYSKGNYNTTGADYAEYFEWLDGNTDNEDRTGIFVTLDGNKIKPADENSYILGIISANPSVIGNSDEHWMGQFKKDEFNRYVIEERTEIVKKIKPEILLDEDGNAVLDEDGNPIITEKEVEKEITFSAYVENGGYDKDKGYVQRCDRPEWDAVGLLGQLVCYDDGTCQVNGYCKCGKNSIGTAATFDEWSFQTPVYRVMERVSDNLVRVLLK